MDEMAVELGMDHEVNRAGVKGYGEQHHASSQRLWTGRELRW